MSEIAPLTFAEAASPELSAAESARRLRALVDTNFDFVWRSLRGLGVPYALLDDASQQVFLIASRRLASIEVGAERAFLFGTARGVAANVRRAVARAPTAADGDWLNSFADASPGADQVLEDREALAFLTRVLEDMPTELREVFVLYELEEMSMIEIARAIAIPAGTVASRLRRARQAFQDVAQKRRTRTFVAKAAP